MGSNKTMENLNVTYLTVWQDPKPVRTVKFGNKGMHRKSVTYNHENTLFYLLLRALELVA